MNRRWPTWGIVAVTISAGWLSAAEPAKDDIEFFEKKIRPVLVEHCYKCHSEKAEKLQGKLLLDSREAARKGGESGAAVVPGDPDGSLLVQALRFENFEMPPGGKLPAEVIADFERWISRGAADPRDGSGLPAAAPITIDFAKGRQFWSFQPPQPHTAPPVANETWSRRKIDGFLLAPLEQSGLEPASEADRRTWLRRVTFD
ncbi:MAG TPA: c-type cytochrome domain-containing protein, partial [Pirellulaceae bacterium]|nr:c-type cytochrome domain-containing protein [Pirellulaceae bacterium]